ncbi:methyl-accepting chemotaxis protein [Paenibacillus rigui]|nr:methyl-accepting chemotaxis protein [Paenibacillus rigui]
MTSIKWKIMLFVAAVIIVILGSNVYFVKNMLDKTTDYSSELLQKQLEDKVAMVEKGVNGYVADVTQTAAFLADQMAQDKQVVRAVKENNKELLHSALDSSSRIAKEKIGIDLIWVTSLKERTSDGKTPILACPTNPSFDGFGQLQYASTNASLDSGQTVISWEVNEEDGKLQISAPIKDTDGKVIGAIVVGQQAYQAMFSKIAESTQAGSTLFLVSDQTDYYVMTDVQKDAIGQQMFADSHEKLKDQARNVSKLAAHNADYAALVPLLNQVKSSKKPLIQVVQLGGQSYASYLLPLLSHDGAIQGVLMNRIPGFVASQQEMLKQSASLQGTAILVFLLLFLLSLMAAYWISHRIASPIRDMVGFVSDIAAGDLTRQLQLQSKDEIGELSRHIILMKENLHGIITEISHSSNQVAALSEELTASAEESGKASSFISASISEVAEGAESQFTSVQDSQDALHKIATDSDRITGFVQEVNRTTQAASYLSQTGKEVISSTVNQMHLIRGKTDILEQVLLALEAKSKEIGHIVALITNISNQTNILSLNASIEAARAGEYGKGFSVIANEIRMLAEQTRNSADQIQQLISDIQNESFQSIHSLNESQAAIKEGAALVAEAGNTFTGIYGSVDQVAGQMKDISSSIEQINTKIGHLLSSTLSISEISHTSVSHTQNVAASAEEQTASMMEISSSAASLSEMAADLQSLAHRFKI